jgi:hypothetical protein
MSALLKGLLPFQTLVAPFTWLLNQGALGKVVYHRLVQL